MGGEPGQAWKWSEEKASESPTCDFPGRFSHPRSFLSFPCPPPADGPRRKLADSALHASGAVGGDSCPCVSLMPQALGHRKPSGGPRLLWPWSRCRGFLKEEWVQSEFQTRSEKFLITFPRVSSPAGLFSWVVGMRENWIMGWLLMR